MIRSAEISGSGIAAQACSTLLRRFGWAANTPGPGPTPVPYVVINSVTASLIKDIFEVDVPSMGGHEISCRLVVNHWEDHISRVNEPAFVVSAASLKSLTGKDSSLGPLSADAVWRVFAGKQPPEGHLATSGNRKGWIFDATSRASFAPDVSVFEFVPEGWLFWAPLGTRKGFLQLILPRIREDVIEVCRVALGQTRILKNAVALGDCVTSCLPCAAGLHSQLTGPDWIATGTSALRYDPVSGDGTGASLRTAILACATLRAVAENEEPEGYLRYYRYRLRKAFYQHLRICGSLYVPAGLSDAWDDDIDCIHRHCLESVSYESNAPSLRLHDYKLAPA